MQIVQSFFLNDGKGSNHGQAAHLIAIDRPGDFAQLLDNIRRTNYYDRSYLETHSALRPRSKVPHFWFVAQILLGLGARWTLEVGCARGDLLFFLARRGCDVTGIDVSPDVNALVWPELRGRLRVGDIREQCHSLAREGRRFDTIIGLDIWEHLLPTSLDEYLRSVSRIAERDAILFTVIPAFGLDRVFGELFPLEFEENRTCFDERQLFEYLLAEKLDPPIPAQGHLIWAHSEWWEERFSDHRWTRAIEVERVIHSAFDDLLPPSVRALYVFHRPGEAQARLERAVELFTAWGHRFELALRMTRDLIRGEISLTREVPRLVDKFVGPAIPDPIRSLLRKALPLQ